MAAAFYDVYVDSRVVETHLLRCQALSLRLPADAVISGRSAAQIWGACMGEADDPIEVLCPRRLTAEGVRATRGSLAQAERAVWYGVPVPIVAHTAWELARTLPLPDAVCWVDALANARNLGTDRLVGHARVHIGERGSPSAMTALPLCDGRSESPPESRLRLELTRAGLPKPVPQWIVTLRGSFVARVDLAWPQWRFALEYDGQWHADRDQLFRDRERIRSLNASGWYVYPVTRNDMRNMSRLIGEVRRLLAARSHAGA
jgi:hypothetical protein